jgi:hypothetical protein
LKPALADTDLLLPAKRIEARAPVAEMLGGKPTIERDGDRMFMRVGADYRPLLKAAGAVFSSVVAGERFALSLRSPSA